MSGCNGEFNFVGEQYCSIVTPGAANPIMGAIVTPGAVNHVMYRTVVTPGAAIMVLVPLGAGTHVMGG